jgi:lysophospholipase L1-like esterase
MADAWRRLASERKGGGEAVKTPGGWIVKRALDLGILASASVFLAVLLTGPVAATLAGVPVHVTHAHTPFALLLLLALGRMALTIELAKTLLVVGSLTLTLLAVEVVLRVWDPPLARPRTTEIHAASPLFGWELVPGASGIGNLGESYRINSAGLRDAEYPVAKRAGIRRLVAIGDSFTYGTGVDLEDTYPKQLERMLNRGGRTYEVINFGVMAYNMWQYTEVLSRKALAYAPDLVVLGLFEDDIGAAVSPHVPSAVQTLRRTAVWNLARNARTQLEHKYRYRRGATYLGGIEARKRWWGPARPTDPHYRIMSGKLDQAQYDAFATALRRFVATARGAGAGVLIVLIPDSVQLNDPHMQHVNGFVRRLAAEMGVPFVDTTPFLEAEDDHESLYLFPYDAHNSPKGLRVIARAIADRIQELGLLAPPVTGPRVALPD